MAGITFSVSRDAVMEELPGLRLAGEMGRYEALAT
jgi:hypothetical protein